MNEKETLYIGDCNICGQGRQMVMCEIASGTYFICCENCESEWRDPSHIRTADVLPRGTFGRARFAEREEMTEHPWSAFIKNLAVI